MFYTHPFGGLISIFPPAVHEGQLDLTLDMKINPFPYTLYSRMHFSTKQKVTKMRHNVSSNAYSPAYKFFLCWTKMS